jgi:hypothetical protein
MDNTMPLRTTVEEGLKQFLVRENRKAAQKASDRIFAKRFWQVWAMVIAALFGIGTIWNVLFPPARYHFTKTVDFPMRGYYYYHGSNAKIDVTGITVTVTPEMRFIKGEQYGDTCALKPVSPLFRDSFIENVVVEVPCRLLNAPA